MKQKIKKVKSNVIFDKDEYNTLEIELIKLVKN